MIKPKQKWVFTYDKKRGKILTYGFSNIILEENWTYLNYSCKSFKAFKRYLRKNPQLKNKGQIILGSKYIGYSIYANWK